MTDHAPLTADTAPVRPAPAAIAPYDGRLAGGTPVVLVAGVTG